ncbi:MAG: EamA family transporter [Verrucomicrobiales bacterium]|nr:EamA family transporter [Verrucomicrobiales bacterium]
MERGIFSAEGGWAASVFLGSVISLSVGNVLLKVGMDRWGAAGAGLPLAGGVVLLAVQFLGMLVLFRYGWPVSVVVPLLGLNHALTALLGRLWLRETVDGWRWAGIALVVVGIFMISAPWLSRKAP